MAQTYLDLVQQCDNFPYYEDNPRLYRDFQRQFYAFRVSGCDLPLGYIPIAVIDGFPWPECWKIDHHERSIILGTGYPETSTARNELVAKTVRQMAESNQFAILRGWRNETFPVFGPNRELLLEIERAASALFGIVTCGVQLTCYVEEDDDLRIWVGRRSRTKQTYPGMLDNAAAGGLGTGQLPGRAVVQEAVEEASLPESVLSRGLISTGCLSYYQVRGPQAGGEGGLLQPEIEYVYELKLDANTIPQPGDSEVEEFNLWSVEEVQGALRRGEFKPNSAIVLIDFFIRHGILTPENEPDYLEIITRLHRRLEFPTAVSC